MKHAPLYLFGLIALASLMPIIFVMAYGMLI